MKLMGGLKDKFTSTETMENNQNVSAQEDMELTMDELVDVAGGRNKMLMRGVCQCGALNDVDLNKDEFTCSKCGKLNRIMG